jgi:hypothetical protein
LSGSVLTLGTQFGSCLRDGICHLALQVVIGYIFEGGTHSVDNGEVLVSPGIPLLQPPQVLDRHQGGNRNAALLYQHPCFTPKDAIEKPAPVAPYICCFHRLCNRFAPSHIILPC